MRRISLIFFVILAAMVSIVAQGKTLDTINGQIKSLKAEKYMETRYDKPSNTAKVMAFAADFGKDQDGANNLSSFNFGMTYFFVGNTMTTIPDSFTTTFWAEEKKPSLANDNALKIVVDGETLDIGNARYARKNGDPRSFLNYTISRQYIEKVVKGRDVQLKIGKTQFKFRPEHITLFNNLLTVSDPAR